VPAGRATACTDSTMATRRGSDQGRCGEVEALRANPADEKTLWENRERDAQHKEQTQPEWDVQ
jgi:hypothetical protein